MSDDDNLDSDKTELRDLLNQLQADHRQVDEEIVALQEIGAVDMLKIGRMKKIKLILKDKIAIVKDKLMPDIIA